ncbi:MAG TPA: RodZ domain-containing protein [Acetobacteraceae bacterium]|nr:RodZ domain-containing protein [Acetobacteraceae bacterium]
MREQAETARSAVGSDLAIARQRLSVSIEEAAAALRIRADYLRALEEGRPERLPGSAYALAFLRTYAAALGLNADQIVQRYKDEAEVLRRTPRLDFPQPAASGSLPIGAAALVAVLLAVVAYAGWYRLSGDGRLPAEPVPAVPERLASLTAPAPPPPASQPVSPPVPPQPQIVAEAGDAGRAAPTIYPSQAAAAVPPAPGVQSAAVLASNEASPGAAPAPISVHALADAWVQVKDRQGHVVFSRLMHAGESWDAPSRDLLLTTGNAGGTELVADGTATGPLGAPGVVRRDLPLDPLQLRDARSASVAPVAAAR